MIGICMDSRIFSVFMDSYWIQCIHWICYHQHQDSSLNIFTLKDTVSEGGFISILFYLPCVFFSETLHSVKLALLEFGTCFSLIGNLQYKSVCSTYAKGMSFAWFYLFFLSFGGCWKRFWLGSCHCPTAQGSWKQRILKVDIELPLMRRNCL